MYTKEQLIELYQFDTGEARLNGLKPKLDYAINKLLLRATAACLETCRHPVTGKLRLLPAMQILSGNQSMKSTAAKRLINSLFGYPQAATISISELNKLVNTESGESK